jgi:hypothetical protein
MPSLSMDSLPVKDEPRLAVGTDGGGQGAGGEDAVVGPVGFDQDAAVRAHGHGCPQGVFRGRFSQAHGDHLVPVDGCLDGGRFGKRVLVVGIHQKGDFSLIPFLPSTVMVAAESGTCLTQT